MRTATPPHAPRRLGRRLRLALTGAAAATLAVGSLVAGAHVATTPAHGPTSVDAGLRLAAGHPARAAANPVTPGDFTGYGFDQCYAPTQASMDAWLNNSPFLAVGIYISGDSRACRNQSNLTPAWIRTQLGKGWRLLPITMGPQASCQPRFPRYSDDYKISPKLGSGRNYDTARREGRATATQTVSDAKALGIVPGSTLWYDLEGFDSSNTACRESALAFLNAWTNQLHDLGYVSGVYSSAGSGIAALDDARVDRPGAYVMPDRIWLARWDGVANTSTDYIRADGWRPGNRVKQYQGGHDETWGGVRINIDRNYLDVGKGSTKSAAESHCGGVGISFKDYVPINPPRTGSTPPPLPVKALQCLLSERGAYSGKITGTYSAPLVSATRSWQAAQGFTADPNGRWYRRDWMSLLSAGLHPVQKIGSVGGYVRRVQRSLNAAGLGYELTMNGVYDRATLAAVTDYQRRENVSPSGVVNGITWSKLIHGKR